MGESSSSKRKISESSEDQQTAKKRRFSEAENEKPKIDQIVKGYLCLECNLFFADKKGFFMHSKETKHPKSQSVAHFLGKERQPSLKLRDLAYSQNHGHSVRKRIKRAVKAGDLSRDNRNYANGERTCKWKDCRFATVASMEMFKHIEDNHLPKKKH